MTSALLTSMVLLFSAANTNDVRWTLDAKPVHTGTVTCKGVQGDGNYLYMIFEVTNKNGRDVPLKLSLQADTDVTGRSYRATPDPVVKAAVERRQGKKFKSLSESRGTIEDGETVTVIASFGKIDPNVDEFYIHLQGLKDRVFVDKYKTWTEDLALTYTYTRKGDEFYRQLDLLKFKSRRWTTEKERQELRRRR